MDEDLQSRKRVLEGALLISVQKRSSQPPPLLMSMPAHACIGSTGLHRQVNATAQPLELLSGLGGILTGKSSEGFHLVVPNPENVSLGSWMDKTDEKSMGSMK